MRLRYLDPKLDPRFDNRLSINCANDVRVQVVRYRAWDRAQRSSHNARQKIRRLTSEH